MAVFKCKMCGGTVEFEPGATVGVCDSCGTKQTLPRLDDDRRANLYDRANHFRRNNDFDKAAGLYEQILNEDSADAEAYWSLVLCRYGIEYVEDPATHRRVPTVNRAQFTSVFDDDNYKSAIQYADLAQRQLYEEEARAINEIQKGILSISQKEEPFDVFICYKETDAGGRRTPDSVLANDLYHQLTQEGFKVFFARITLEDKLGAAYEPYIFAALNSARVMVVLGTRPEYFNAVWVKNEWSRYLALVKTSGGKKVLIPAYKDMDPYDLPEEFSHLQAQDMSKLGFMQDLIRGIKKIAQKETPAPAASPAAAVPAAGANTAPLLKRAFMFLEDGNWQEADAYCEKVLDIDPENAQAYLGKLMAELKVQRQENLKDCARPFAYSGNYQKAVRFGGAAMKEQLAGYISVIIGRQRRMAEQKNERQRQIEELQERLAHLSPEKLDLPEYQRLVGEAEVLKKEAQEAKTAYDTASENGNQEKQRLQAEIEEQKKRKAGLSIFNGKERKEVQQQIDELTRELEELENGLGKGLAEKQSAREEAEARAEKACLAIRNYTIMPLLRGKAKLMQKMCELGVAENELPKLDVLQTIEFGQYIQDENGSTAPIEWFVLALTPYRALLISKFNLICKPYNTSKAEVTWESCTLRKWLNEDFFNAVFSDEEKAMIPTVTVSADKNPDYGTNPGNATQDKVFLLSIAEVNRYFKSNEERMGTPTAYAKANGTYPGKKHIKVGAGARLWWLRSPGQYQHEAAIVDLDGHVYSSGSAVNSVFSVGFETYDYNICVRPALWIALEEK